jgi:hypothetical protein
MKPMPIGNLLLELVANPPKGLLTDEQAKALDAKRNGEGHRERRLANIRRSGIGKHLGPGDASRIVRDELRVTEAMKLVSWWAKPERDTARRWLLLGGERGQGKTVAAAWLLARDGGRYTTMLELVTAYGPLLRGLAPTTQDEIADRLNAIAGAETLVLDELGRDGLSAEIAREALHWLVEARHGMRRGRTLVLSNLSAKDIRARFNDGTYDPRTESRLRPLLTRRRDGGAVFEVVGKDMRGAPL